MQLDQKSVLFLLLYPGNGGKPNPKHYAVIPILEGVIMGRAQYKIGNIQNFLAIAGILSF